MPTRNTVLSWAFVVAIVVGGLAMVSVPIAKQQHRDRVSAALNELRESKMRNPYAGVSARDRLCERDFSAYLADKQAGYADECKPLLK